ncbi:hypothetical protein BDZ89DRAFT_1067873 [Hymenopellis radicata]|nr:hypothetical protein BDZ89DRAFT_1067873 [Hymenopellis radicata]
MVSVFLDANEAPASSSTCPQPNSSNKRKLSLFTPSGKRSSRLSSLLSLSSSRKSPPTCTISLECATINVPCHGTESIDAVLSECPPADVNVIPFPTSCETDADPDLDTVQLDAVVKVRRRSMQATPRSSLSEEHRTRKDSLERTRKDSFERTRKTSVSKRKPSRRALVHHTLLAPASRKPPSLPRKRLPHIKHSDLRFLTVVWRSVQVGLDERMVDQESDLQEQDRLFVHRLGVQLAERGVRDDADPVSSILTPSQIVAAATLRRRDSAAVRSAHAGTRDSKTAAPRRPSPLASS